MSQIFKSDTSSPAADVETLTGNSGGAVGPDAAFNIDVQASGGFTVVGTPASNLLNVSPSGWTAGSVVFSNSATSFAQDNSNFFWDDANNFLGIGTNTPHAPLQFASVINRRKSVFFEVANNDHQFLGLGVISATLVYQVPDTSTNHIFFAGTSTTTSNELMRIQGNGNVGISETSPNTRLHVTQAATGPQILATFENSEVGAGTSEARIVFATGGNYYGGIGTKFNNTNPRTTISTSAAANPDTWNPSFSVWNNESVSIGPTYFDIIAPASGMIVEGSVGIGTSSPSSLSKMVVVSTNNLNTVLQGTQTVVSGDNQSCLFVQPTFSPASTIVGCRAIRSEPICATGSGVTVTYMSGLDVSLQSDSNVGTITTLIGVNILSGTTNTGTVTNAYGLFVEEPDAGSTKITAYFENKVGIGTTLPINAAILDIQSTTAGVRFPTMTTAQKNAIGSPQPGLVVYDTTLNKLCVYTTAWETITSV